MQWIIVKDSFSSCVVRLWNLQTFTVMVCFKGHNYPVWSVEFRWVKEMIRTCGGFITLSPLLSLSLLSLSLSLHFPPPKPPWVLLCDRFPWQDCQSMEHRPHSAAEDTGRTSQWCWCMSLAILLYQGYQKQSADGQAQLDVGGEVVNNLHAKHAA